MDTIKQKYQSVREEGIRNKAQSIRAEGIRNKAVSARPTQYNIGVSPGSLTRSSPA